MAILRDTTDSLAINSLSYPAEVMFYRLLQKCDDYGRFHADPLLLKSQLFPLRPNTRVTEIARWFSELEAAPLIRSYVDGRGRKLLQILKWRDGKKFKRSSFDPPDDERQTPLALEEKGTDKDYKALLTLSVPEGGCGGKPKLTAAQRETLALCECVLDGEWINDAGKWVNRTKSAREKVERVMNEVRSARLEGRVLTTPAAMAEDTWKRFR